MTEPDARPSTPEHRDRRAGLIVFGIVLIVVGVTTALLAVMLLAGPLAMPGAGTVAAATRPADRTLVPAIVTYAALAVLFVWLGAGSILTRRWAPPLILTAAWLWLISGLIGVGLMAALLPSAFALAESQSGPMPDSLRTALTVTLLGVSSLILVLLPLALMLFYRSPDVQATCDARDPVPRWTDGRPLALIGVGLSLALMAASLLPAALFYNGVAPVFGAVLTGMPGVALNLALAMVWAYCAWGTVRGDLRAWWVAVISVSVASVSAALTFARIDPRDMLRLMGVAPDQLPPEWPMGPSTMIALVVAVWLSLMACLVSVKRHVRR
jgi:hypothetical protein